MSEGFSEDDRAMLRDVLQCQRAIEKRLTTIEKEIGRVIDETPTKVLIKALRDRADDMRASMETIRDLALRGKDEP